VVLVYFVKGSRLLDIFFKGTKIFIQVNLFILSTAKLQKVYSLYN